MPRTNMQDMTVEAICGERGVSIRIRGTLAGVGVSLTIVDAEQVLPEAQFFEARQRIPAVA